MTSNDRDPASENEAGTETDVDDPLDELRRYRVAAAPGLVGRVRNSIQRRNLVAEITSFSVLTPFMVVMELLRSIFEPTAGPNSAAEETGARDE